VALEIDLMPAEAYDKAQCASSRVSCVVLFRSFNDRPREVFIPPVYGGEIEFILEDLDLERTVTSSREEIPRDTESRISVRFFPDAGVGRFTVLSAGWDFPGWVDHLEAQGAMNGTRVFQYFLSLAEPWAGLVVECLRERGYFLGGYVPRWFDADGLLMQKTGTVPDFDAIKLHSEKAKKIRDFVRSDRQRAGS